MGRPRAPHLLLPQLNISLVLVNAMLWLAPTATHCTWQSQEQQKQQKQQWSSRATATATASGRGKNPQ